MIEPQIEWISEFFGAQPTMNTSDNHNMQWAEWRTPKYYIFIYESNPTWFAINKAGKKRNTIIQSPMPHTESYFKILMTCIRIKK